MVADRPLLVTYRSSIKARSSIEAWTETSTENVIKNLNCKLEFTMIVIGFLVVEQQRGCEGGHHQEDEDWHHKDRECYEGKASSKKQGTAW